MSLKKILTVRGTHCSSCKEVIEDVCHDTPGILSCSLDVEKGELTVEYTQEENLTTLKKEIDSLGSYTLEL